jgi:hypothetical protein
MMFHLTPFYLTWIHNSVHIILPQNFALFLWKFCIIYTSSYLYSSIPEYRLVYIIIDVAHHRLFGPPCIIDKRELRKPCRFLHLKFDNKGIDAVNIHSILTQKNPVQFCFTQYFQMNSTPCTSDRYTFTIASKLLN